MKTFDLMDEMISQAKKDYVEPDELLQRLKHELYPRTGKMGKRIKWSADDVKTIKRLYRENTPIHSIATQFQVADQTIKSLLVKCGVATN